MKNYDLLEATNDQIETILYTKRLPNDSLFSYKKSYVERTKKLFVERDRLQSEERKQAFLIYILIIIAVILIASIVYLCIRKRRKNVFLDAKQNAWTIANQSTATMILPTVEDYPICFKIRKNASKAEFRLQESEWGSLFSEMDSLYSDFTMRLRALYPRITDVELTVCCLTKLDVRNVDTAHILCRGESSVSSIRSRLYEKISGVKGSSRLFVDFIRTF